MSLAAGRPASKASGATAPPILRWFVRRTGRRDPALTIVEASLQTDERVEATAYCSAGIGGLGEAGLAALTNHRIVFVPRKGPGPVRSYPYVRVRAVHEEARVGPQRRIRVALTGAPTLHLVAGVERRADPCEIIHRHARLT
jgi:hypothetical protein